MSAVSTGSRSFHFPREESSIAISEALFLGREKIKHIGRLAKHCAWCTRAINQYRFHINRWNPHWLNAHVRQTHVWQAENKCPTGREFYSVHYFHLKSRDILTSGDPCPYPFLWPCQVPRMRNSQEKVNLKVKLCTVFHWN